MLGNYGLGVEWNLAVPCLLWHRGPEFCDLLQSRWRRLLMPFLTQINIAIRAILECTICVSSEKISLQVCYTTDTWYFIIIYTWGSQNFKNTVNAVLIIRYSSLTCKTVLLSLSLPPLSLSLSLSLSETFTMHWLLS